MPLPGGHKSPALLNLAGGGECVKEYLRESQSRDRVLTGAMACWQCTAGLFHVERGPFQSRDRKRAGPRERSPIPIPSPRLIIQLMSIAPRTIFNGEYFPWSFVQPVEQFEPLPDSFWLLEFLGSFGW